MKEGATQWHKVIKGDHCWSSKCNGTGLLHSRFVYFDVAWPSIDSCWTNILCTMFQVHIMAAFIFRKNKTKGGLVN